MSESCIGYESRGCPVCGLREQHRIGDPWTLALSCIRPVPDKISFGLLREDLKAHPAKVRMSSGRICETTFEERVRCFGHPKKWLVGLSLGHAPPYVFPSVRLLSNGELMQWPVAAGYVRELEEGFALLLRAMRVRRYNPYLLSDFDREEALARERYIPA